MRNLIAFALLTLVVAALVPPLLMDISEHTGRTASEAADAPPSPDLPSPYPPAPVAAGGYRSMTLQRGRNGHFHVDAMLNGRQMAFLIDTGASVVALRESDAARLGIRPMPRDYTARVATANGTVMAAPANIRRIEVGSLMAQDVAALVLPDTALGQNLLGMSFLSRVRFEHRDGKLVLEQ
ncbi:putative exported Uncharacterized protein with protease domajn [Rhodovulum sp. PH10]|uniref:retropepsin-like aspartic protease family protein n=1 Tax=Rhodovulum sp. PH10 TaxID=1187851 RepID=UPI00027C253A|nr:TIGR02281 family clan AA aspartic protease [Rhodovulum sp. PH10]EJW11330.1 putative exported Uncharacterized protein with protease domajn [Rhodovulum sp. PH10]